MANNNDWQDVPLDDWQDVPHETGKLPFFEGLAKSSIESLPIVGSMVGGALGGAAGLITPVPGGAAIGAIGGSGLGAMAGKSLEQGLKGVIYGEAPESRSEQYKQLALEGAAGSIGELGGQAAGKVIQKGLELGGKALPKIGHALTGISEQEIKTYAKNADEIKKMASATDGSTIEAADLIRQQYSKDIQATKKGLNDAISQSLLNSEKRIDISKVKRALLDEQLKINKKLYPEQVQQIEDLINKVDSVATNGTVSANEAHQIKQFLQDKASTAYTNPGEIFSLGSEAANASKKGAVEARLLINDAEPAVANANEKLARLHEIQDSMNSNILKTGKPESALMAAGTGGNPRNARALEQLGEITGTPMLEQSQNLAAMRTFTNPPFLPVDTTGKSVARMGLGTGIGGAIGGIPGSIVGGGLASPMSLKAIIDTSNKVAPVVKGISKALPEAPTREMLYKGLIQKNIDKFVQPEEKPQRPDQTSILNKLKGSPYEQLLNNAKQNGGDQSFAAANYVLMNRDSKYRDLINSEGEIEGEA